MSPRPRLTAGDRFVPWSSAVCTGWPLKPLKGVAHINRCVLPETTPPERLLEYVDIGSVDSWGRISDVTATTFGAAPSRARRVPRAGDTIVSTVRTYLRAVAFIENPTPNLVCSTGFAVLSPGRTLHPKFFFYWLLSNHFVDEVCARSTGVSYPALNPTEIGQLPVATPPLDVQRRVAEFLDRKTAAIDVLVEKKEQLAVLLAARRQALIANVLTRGLDASAPMTDSGIQSLGMIPSGWRVVKLRRIAAVGQGDAFAHELQGQQSGELPWFKVADMNRPGNEVEMHTADNYVAHRTAMEARATIFPAGAVVFPRVGAALLTNKRRILTRPSVIDDNTYAVVPNRAVRSRYLYLSLMLVDMARIASAGLVPTVNFAAVKDLEMVLPPVPEQDRIVQHVDSECAGLDALVASSARSVQNLRDYRQALITAAVTGQLDVAAQPKEAA